MEDTAIYIILNEDLKYMEDWRMPNTICMLGMLIGTKVDDSCVGPNITDASGVEHNGIGNVVLPDLVAKMMEIDDHILDTGFPQSFQLMLN